MKGYILSYYSLTREASAGRAITTDILHGGVETARQGYMSNSLQPAVTKGSQGLLNVVYCALILIYLSSRYQRLLKAGKVENC